MARTFDEFQSLKNVGNPELPFQILAPQRRCQQTRHGGLDQEPVPEQRRDGDGGVAFLRKIWPHLSDWQPGRQLTLRQNKHGGQHVYLSHENQFDWEGTDRNRIPTEKAITMTATVKVVPHSSHGGLPFEIDI